MANRPYRGSLPPLASDIVCDKRKKKKSPAIPPVSDTEENSGEFMANRPYRGPLPPLASDIVCDKPKKKKSPAISPVSDTEDDSYNSDEARVIIPLLASRACHLPGNNVCQDWMQFIKNNHPVLGILCHHPLHPIRISQRIVNLIGSVAFGLTATNIVFLMHVYYETSMDEVFFRVSLSGGGAEDPDITASDIEQLEITYGAITLWTLGGALHSVFDLSLWFLSACACFLPGGCFENQRNLHSIGSYCVISIVAILVAITTSLVVLRVSYESRLREKIEDSTEDVDWREVHTLQSYNFLMGYLIELVVVYCVTYQIVASIFFSGILSFGCLPFLGGRPAEVQQELRNINKANSRFASIASAQSNSGASAPSNSGASAPSKSGSHNA